MATRNTAFFDYNKTVTKIKFFCEDCAKLLILAKYDGAKKKKIKKE